MKKVLHALLLTLFSVGSCLGADVVQQRYIDQLTQGGNVSIKQAAQSIYNTKESSTEVLDVAMEVLLQRYPSAQRNDLDTLAWLAKSIGPSKNNRYSSALDEVKNNANKKIAKYAKASWKEVGKNPTAPQYKRGMVDLATMQNASPATPNQPQQSQAAASNGEKSGLDVIREGMSMQEVYALIGTPTATTTHQTGKAWIPFNFSGKDLVRTAALYKGQGRIIFSHDSYSSTTRVLEVLIDPNESGYP